MTNPIRRIARQPISDSSDRRAVRLSAAMPDLNDEAVTLVLTGLRWMVLVDCIAMGMCLWWLSPAGGHAVSEREMIRTIVCFGLIAFVGALVCLPFVRRLLLNMPQSRRSFAIAVPGYLVSSSWIAMTTTFVDMHWPVVLAGLMAVGVGLIAASSSPAALAGRLVGAAVSFTFLGQGLDIKLSFGAVSVIALAMIVSQTRRRQALHKLYQGAVDDAVVAQQMLASFEQSGRGWFFKTDSEGRLTYLSDTQVKIFPGDIIGQPLAELVEIDQVGQGDTASVGAAIEFTLSAGVNFSDLVVRVASEEERWWSLSGVALFDEKGRFTGYHGSGTDLTAQRKTEAEAQQLARYDTLTGLANRSTIAKSLNDLLVPVRGAQPDCGLMLLDLDRFKAVNDTLGHPVGDELLKIVAKRLQRVIGPTCQVGRLGGDEFQIVVPEFGDRTELARLADSVIDRLSLPYVVDGTTIRIGASVGIAVAPGDGVTAEELTRNADIALYSAKEAGKGVHRFFQPEMLQSANDRRALEDDLREIFTNNELRVVFQPIVDSISERVIGYEALARWDHPVRGAVPPSVFIPIAEEMGMVGRIGDWVVREACRQAAGWPEHLHVAVNLSPKQFDVAGLSRTLGTILSETGLAPERLELEITEGVLLAKSAEADETLSQLTSLGVRLVLDDFGTGYASLGYLRRVAFSKIKIDQSFVRGAADLSSRNSAIIRAIVSLADSLGMQTVAEGVETLDEIELIRSLGCTHMQGYIFGAPMDRDATAEAAQSQPAPPSAEEEQAEVDRDPRISLLRIARLRSGSSTAMIKIRNVSSRGALLEVPGDLPIKPDVELELSDGTRLRGQVRWRKAHRIGLYFVEPIDVALVVGKPSLVKQDENASAGETKASRAA